MCLLHVQNVCGDADNHSDHSTAAIWYTGTGTGATNLDVDCKTVSATNPVYATCDTLPSVTAGMVESMDEDPPGYSTVQMVVCVCKQREIG